jgi:tetratricopeptide (TPR) repeat protein
MRLILLIAVFFSLNIQAQDQLYTEEVIGNYENGVLAYQNNDRDGAKALFSKCISVDSSCFEAYYGLGLIHFEEKNFDQSLLTTNKAKALRPFDPKLTGLRGRIYFQKSNYLQAETLLKRAISIGDNDPENILYLALALQEQDKYTTALHYFNELVNTYPLEADYWYNRGLLYMDMEEYSSAQIDFKKALEIADSPIDNIYFHLATVALALGDGEETLAQIAEGLKTTDKDEKVLLLVLKGNFYRNIGEYNEAETFYNEAFNLQNDNPLVLTHQAVVLIDLEKYDLAIAKCDDALVFNPNQKEAYFNRGIANEMIRDVEQACSDWQKAFVLGSQKAIQYLNGPVCNE